jgi:MFS family permease
MSVTFAAGTSHTRELVLAMSTALCYGIALGLFPALLALNVESSGFDTYWNGLLGAVPALAGMAIGPFTPRIVARLGARPSYFAGAALSISTAALFPFLPSLGAWFVLRFLMGAGLAIQFVVGESWVNNLAQSGTRGRILGVYVIALSVGLFIGPSIMSFAGTRGISHSSPLRRSYCSPACPSYRHGACSRLLKTARASCGLSTRCCASHQP